MQIQHEQWSFTKQNFVDQDLRNPGVVKIVDILEVIGARWELLICYSIAKRCMFIFHPLPLRSLIISQGMISKRTTAKKAVISTERWRLLHASRISSAWFQVPFKVHKYLILNLTYDRSAAKQAAASLQGRPFEEQYIKFVERD